MEPKRILIVANQTAGGQHLRDVVARRIADGPCAFTLLVPASPSEEHVTWTHGENQKLAEARLQEAMAGLREIGASVEGMIGSTSAFESVADVLREHPQDEIIVSTLPLGVSRWLKQDLPHRVERAFGLPVTHVVAIPAVQG